MDFNEFYLCKIIPNKILLEGEDEFLHKIAIKKIKKTYNIEDIDMSEFYKEDSENLIYNSVLTVPFISEKRLVIAKEFYPKSKGVKEFNVNENTILLICNNQKNEIVKKTVDIVVDCSKCEEFIKNFLSSKFKKNNLVIEQGVINKIIDFCSCDAFRCNTESDKLISYSLDKGKIEISDIERVVVPDFDYKIYELTEFIASKNTRKAYVTLQDMINKNEPSHKLFISVYNHFRRLFYCKLNQDSLELSEMLGIKEYAVKKAQGVASKFSATELKNIVERFNEYDYCVKSGKMDIFNALWLAVFHVCA